MKYITGFFAFWWDFIVGDAWEVAAGILLTLLLVYGIVHGTGSAFAAQYAGLLMPLAVVVLLAISLWLVGRKRSRP